MEDRGPLTNIINWLFTGASIIIVSLRLVSRLKLSNLAGWDDLYISIALLLVVFDSALTSYAVSQGLGKHMSSLTLEVAINAGKWSVAADTVAIFTFTTPKLAVAVLLARILTLGDRPSNLHRYLLYGPAVAIMLWSFIALGVWLGQCQPASGLWDKSIQSICYSPNVYLGVGSTLGALSALFDVWYGVYPIFFISKLAMGTRRKVHLCLMLGLEVGGCGCAIFKLTQFSKVSVPNADVTYVSAALIYATLVEANVIIIAACVPTLGPFVHWVTKTPKSRYRHSDNYQQFEDQSGSCKTPNLTPGNSSSNTQTRAYIPGKTPSTRDLELQEFDILAYNKQLRDRSKNSTDADIHINAKTTIDVELSR